MNIEEDILTKPIWEDESSSNNTEIEEILWEKLSFLIKKYDYDELVKTLTKREADIRREAVEGFAKYVDDRQNLEVNEETGEASIWLYYGKWSEDVETYLKENKDE